MYTISNRSSYAVRSVYCWAHSCCQHGSPDYGSDAVTVAAWRLSRKIYSKLARDRGRGARPSRHLHAIARGARRKTAATSSPDSSCSTRALPTTTERADNGRCVFLLIFFSLARFLLRRPLPYSRTLPPFRTPSLRPTPRKNVDRAMT